MILKWFALKNKISSGWTCVSDNELMGWVNSCPSRGTGMLVRCEELLNGVKVGLLSDWLRGIQFHIMLSLFSLVESSHLVWVWVWRAYDSILHNSMFWGSCWVNNKLTNNFGEKIRKYALILAQRSFILFIFSRPHQWSSCPYKSEHFSILI